MEKYTFEYTDEKNYILYDNYKRISICRKPKSPITINADDYSSFGGNFVILFNRNYPDSHDNDINDIYNKPSSYSYDDKYPEFPETKITNAKVVTTNIGLIGIFLKNTENKNVLVIYDLLAKYDLNYDNITKVKQGSGLSIENKKDNPLSYKNIICYNREVTENIKDKDTGELVTVTKRCLITKPRICLVDEKHAYGSIDLDIPAGVMYKGLHEFPKENNDIKVFTFFKKHYFYISEPPTSYSDEVQIIPCGNNLYYFSYDESYNKEIVGFELVRELTDTKDCILEVL